MSVMERMKANSLMERCVGLENDAHVRADPLHVVCVERQADGEPLVDEPVAKGRAAEVEGDQHGLFMS